jgi:hypothetical protein
MGASASEVEVLSGNAGETLRWVVVCSADGPDLCTLLRVYDADKLVVAGSGFAGTPLEPGSVMKEWRGRTDDLPYFVMARTAPIVTRVVATTDQGLDVEMRLSEPVERFGLRFAATALPAGHGPLRIRAERDGTVVDEQPQPMPPPRLRPA